MSNMFHYNSSTISEPRFHFENFQNLISFWKFSESEIQFELFLEFEKFSDSEFHFENKIQTIEV